MCANSINVLEIHSFHPVSKLLNDSFGLPPIYLQCSNTVLLSLFLIPPCINPSPCEENMRLFRARREVPYTPLQDARPASLTQFSEINSESNIFE